MASNPWGLVNTPGGWGSPASPASEPTGQQIGDLPSWSPIALPDSPGTTILPGADGGGCGGAVIVSPGMPGSGNGACCASCAAKANGKDDTVTRVEAWARDHQGWILLIALAVAVLAMGRRN